MAYSSRLKQILLPGFVFQSVVIAGGYGTGRELVEFFLSQWPLGGLLAMAVSTLLWSLVCAVTYELARVLGAYDYRSLLKGLLGRAWGLYEGAYLLFMLLILAVIAAAAGTILQETFRVPYWIGVGGMMVAVGSLVPGGSKLIEGVMAFWSVVLYDNDTRCMIENPQGKTEVNSRQELVKNDDGSVRLVFSPERPDGVPEANWIQTNPEKGFFAYFRWYSPTQAFFDRSWKMGNIEEVR